MCPSSLSLSLSNPLFFQKLFSPHRDDYNTHTHKVLLLVVVVVARTRAQEEEKRKREREREREREFVFFQPQNATAKRSTLIYNNNSRKKKLSSLSSFKRVVSVTHEKKEDIKCRVSFKKKKRTYPN